MKKIQKMLKKHGYIAFMDFEGTQFSHEMIAIGAVVAKLDSNGQIKKLKEPFKLYVKAKNPVGHFVTNLTNIDDYLLKKEGVSFKEAMNAFKKYCGIPFSKNMSFVTFGTHDMRILGQSISYNLDAPKEICSVIQKNYIDFSSIISEFVRDEKYNPMSLTHYAELFEVKVDGYAHDPRYDAVVLAELYRKFFDNKSLVLDEYMKVLQKISNLPDPIRIAINKLASGNDVTYDDFLNIARDYIK